MPMAKRRNVRRLAGPGATRLLNTEGGRGERDIPPDYDEVPRKCGGCGKTMSGYNRGEHCFVCRDARQPGKAQVVYISSTKTISGAILNGDEVNFEELRDLMTWNVRK